MEPVEHFQIAETGDARLEEALALVWRVFLAFEAPDYSAEGIEEFRRFIEPESIRRMLADGELRIWTCLHGQSVVGVLALRPPGHISLLFVDGALHRRGIARRLTEALLADRQAAGVSRLTVHSSPYAVAAYRRLGFSDTDREQLVNGLRFVPMERR